MLSEFDIVCIKLAISEAAKTKVSDPAREPKVGAVAARDGKILASAYRGERYPDTAESTPTDHAEFTLLEKKLREPSLAGCTVYTTLEPCTERGPNKVACVDRLLERKVDRVVIGMIDPNGSIRGYGIRKLEAHRVVVDHFPPKEKEQLEDMNREFVRTHTRLDREREAKQKSRKKSQNDGSEKIRKTSVSSGISAGEFSESRLFSEPLRKHMATLHRDIEHLTKDQYRVIQTLRHIRRVRISGCAGSGKTLVASEKAVRMANGGLRVLLLCHNPLLAELIRSLTAGSGVEVQVFGQWITELSNTSEEDRSGHWAHYDQPSDSAITAATDRLVSGTRYDAVIVDEAQDFRDEWWIPVEHALQDSAMSCLYIFYDNKQSLLPHRTPYLVDHPEIDLSRNCRNAGRVFELIRCFDESAPEPEVKLKAQGEVRYIPYDNSFEKKTLHSIAAELYVRDCLRKTVVIVGDDDIASSPFNNQQVEIAEAQSWQAEVQKWFRRILNLRDSEDYIIPSTFVTDVKSALDGLSSAPFPTRQDMHSITLLARTVVVSSIIKRRIRKKEWDTFRWNVSERSLFLSAGHPEPVWPVEGLLFFQKDDWSNGIPKPRIIRFADHHMPRTRDVIPIYRVSDFKGLESDVVILLLRGKSQNHRESVYVGVSRARYLLFLISDSVAGSEVPKNFIWD